MLDYITQRGNAPTRGWAFTGAGRTNTDHGRAWAEITPDGANLAVTIYRDEMRQHAVAAGTREGAGPVSLVALNDSGLAGTVEVAGTGNAELDIFYACEADLAARHTGVAANLNTRDHCADAKRLLDALLAARLGAFRAESLAPLAPAATDYALSFLYSWLSTRPDDPAAALAARFRGSARAALPLIRLTRGAEIVTPFAARARRG